jgi:hypothetical protein
VWWAGSSAFANHTDARTCDPLRTIDREDVVQIVVEEVGR